MLTEGIDRGQKSNFRQNRDPARQGLVVRLRDLSELLGSQPRAELGKIRAVVREARALHQASGIDHGLLALVLHNMVRDLAGAGAQFEASYYARQLSVVIDQVGPV